MWLSIHIFDEREQPADEIVTTVYVAARACFPNSDSYRLIWPDSADMSAQLKAEVEAIVQPFLSEREQDLGSITARDGLDITLRHAASTVAGAVHGAAYSTASHTTQ